jgi:hypothetical protein
MESPETRSMPSEFATIEELRPIWQRSIPPDSFTLNHEAVIATVRLDNTSTNLDEHAFGEDFRSGVRSVWFQWIIHIFAQFSAQFFGRLRIMNTLMEILQHRTTLIRSIFASENLSRRAVELLVISFVSFFVYGFVLGAQHSLAQGLSAATKLPLLFLLTIVITFPTLFIFGSILGTGRSFMQTVVILLAGTTIISLVLVALSPVTLLFGMTTSSYQFFKLLNVGIFIVAWFLGAAFFRAIYAPHAPVIAEADNDSQEEKKVSIEETSRHENQLKVHAYFVRFWFLLYGFVATQIAWMLRPFVCSSSLEFELFRGMRDNVYGDILRSIAHILGFR